MTQHHTNHVRAGATRRTAGPGAFHAAPAPAIDGSAPEYERLEDAARDRAAEALLAIRVRDRLLAKLKLDALPVRVTACGRTVTLTGQLQRRSARVRAELAALSVGGVKKVINQLTLAPGALEDDMPVPVALADGHAIADALLETRVKIRLFARAGTEAFHIQVEASDGVVILSGSVPDELHLDRALRITRATAGVKEIHDLIEIAPAATGQPGH